MEKLKQVWNKMARWQQVVAVVVAAMVLVGIAGGGDSPSSEQEPVAQEQVDEPVEPEEPVEEEPAPEPDEYPMDWEEIINEEDDCATLNDYFWNLSATQEARSDAGDSENASKYLNAMSLADDKLDELGCP